MSIAKPLKALLFDLDGTLANTDPLHFLAWQDILTEHKVSIDEPFYQRQMSGRLNPDIVADLLPELSLRASQQLIEEKERRFRKRAKTLKPLAGLDKLFDWVTAKGLARALVTNAPRKNAEFLLQTLGYSKSFAVTVIAEDFPIGKPDPLLYRQALKHLNLQADEVLAFEDSPSGIRSARSAGIDVIAIASTHAEISLVNEGADFAVADFSDDKLWQHLQQVQG